MALVHRWIAPLIFATLSVASLVATAGEAVPVQFRPTLTSAPQNARVIVKYRVGSSMAKALSVTASGTRVPQHAQALGVRLGLGLVDGRGMDSHTQIVHAIGLSSAALAQRLAQDASVEWAVPDRRVKAHWTPDDTYFNGQWYLHAPSTAAAAAFNAAAAWEITRGSRQVVAVLDTGLSSHLDLSGKTLPGRNMVSLNGVFDGNASGLCISGNGRCRPATTSPDDPGDWVSQSDIDKYQGAFSGCDVTDSSWHGTQVAGIVGASTGNNKGVAGVAPEAQILPVRVLGKCGGWDSDIVAGIEWASGLSVDGNVNPNPATVINLSLGGTAADGPCGALYQGAIDAAIAKGIVVVAAAGNDGLGIGAPGNCRGVVTVAAVQHAGAKASYSSLGKQVTLSAPGGDCPSNIGACGSPILTTFNDGLKSPGNAIYTDAFSNVFLGTSFSAPMVAGTVALMLSANPELSPAQVTSLLQSSAKAFPKSGVSGATSTCGDPANSGTQDFVCYCTATTCGAGMLDAEAAVNLAAGTTVAVITVTPASPSAGQQIVLDASGSKVAPGSTISEYLWEITAGSGIATFTSATSAATATLDTTGAGNVTVRLTIATKDASGTGTGTVSTTKTFTVGGVGFTAAITATATAGTVALDSSTSTVASGRSIVTYLWEITSGSTLASFSGSTSAATATLNVSGNGAVLVKLTLTDSEGLQATASKTIAVSTVTTPSGGSSGGGGGAWSPWGALGLLLAALALPARTLRRR